MLRTVNENLLPLDVRRQRGTITVGAYRALLPTLPAAALADHAEVWAQYCEAAHQVRDPDVPALYLHHFVLPELTARVGRGEHAEPIGDYPAPGRAGPFRLIALPPAKEAAFRQRWAAGQDAQKRLAAMDGPELADEATRARSAVEWRQPADSCVYDATLYHVLLPALIRSAARLPPAAEAA